MFKITLFALVAVFGVAFGSIAVPDNGRIIGGLTAVPGQFKYQVSLRLPGNFHACGASLVNSRWLITAAHCAIPSEFTIVVGTISSTEAKEIYKVKRFIKHPDYDPNKILNDIALVEVDGNISFNDNVQPITFSRHQVHAGENAVVSGWGQTSYPGVVAQILQYLNTKTVDCEPSRICTFSKPGEGACFGDSGGPLVSAGELVGVVSAVVPCAIGYNDVFTRISYFFDWIVSYTG